MSDDNKKYYFDMANEEDSLDGYNYVIEKNEMVTLWEGGKNDAAEEFEPISYDEKTKTFRLRSKGGLLTKLTGSKLTDKDIFIKVPHPKFTFFSTGILQHDKDANEYFIELKRDIYKSQQRTNFRLKASSMSTIQFKIDEQVFDGLDISAGGTSILIEPEDKDRFAKDKEFEGCTIRLNTKNFDIPRAKIAGAWGWNDEGGNPTDKIKLGIAFMGLGPNAEEDLFKHINSEARAEEVKKKFMSKKKK